MTYINPVVRLSVAYALGGSANAYYSPGQRGGFYEINGNANHATFLIGNTQEPPTYTPTASERFPCKTTTIWPYIADDWTVFSIVGTLGTNIPATNGAWIFRSFALHTGSYDNSVGYNWVAGLSQYPLLLGTLFPIRLNSTNNHGVLISASVSAIDHGSVFTAPEMCKISLGGWGGDSAAGVENFSEYFDFNTWYQFVVYDTPSATSFAATQSVRTFSGTIATIVYRARTRRDFNVSGIKCGWRNVGNDYIGATFFLLDQERDPLHYRSGGMMGNWGQVIGSGHQFLATFLIDVLESTHNHNWLNPNNNFASPLESNNDGEIDSYNAGTWSISRRLVFPLHSTVWMTGIYGPVDTATLTDAPAEVIIVQLTDGFGPQEILPAQIAENDALQLRDEVWAYTKQGKKTVYITDERYVQAHGHLHKEDD